MSKFTTIGYFEESPHEPILFTVEAADVPGAIRESERCAQEMACASGQFINTFVLAGDCEVLSTWAG